MSFLVSSLVFMRGIDWIRTERKWNKIDSLERPNFKRFVPILTGLFNSLLENFWLFYGQKQMSHVHVKRPVSSREILPNVNGISEVYKG